MKKKLLSMLLALAMILSMFPVGAWGAERDIDLSASEAFADPEAKFQHDDVGRFIRPAPASASKLAPLADSTSDITNTPYKAYQEPEAVLTGLGYTSEEAESILCGESEEARIAYIANETQLEAAFEAPEIEIVVITQDFSLTKELQLAKSMVFLAPEVHTLSNAILTPEASDAESAFPVMISAGTVSSPLAINTSFIFSNVILDCAESAVGLSVAVNTQVGEEPEQALIEGAYLLNGASAKSNREHSPLIGYGSINYQGCTLTGRYSWLYAYGGEKITIKTLDCTSSAGPEAGTVSVKPAGSGDAELENCNLYQTGIGLGAHTEYNYNNVHAIIRESKLTGDYIGSSVSKLEIENTEIDYTVSPGFFCVAVYGFLTLTMNHVTAIGNQGFLMEAKGQMLTTAAIRNSNLLGSSGSGSGILYSMTYRPDRTTLNLENTELCGFEKAVRIFTTLSSSGNPPSYDNNATVNVTNCDIHDNAYGLPGMKKLNITTSKIRDNARVGIQMNSGNEVVITSSEIENNGGSLAVDGGITYDSLFSDTASLLKITNSTLLSNKSGSDGGAIRIKNSGVPVTIVNSRFSENSAARYGGAIYAQDIGKITTDIQTQFSGNTASEAYEPPANIAASYPKIKFAGTSTASHPLNNYDIVYLVGDLLPNIASVASLEKVMVPLGTTAEELQAVLEETYPQIEAALEDGTTANNIPIIWNVSESEYTGENCAAYTIHGKLNLSGKNYANASSLTADVTVYVGPIVASNPKLGKTTVVHGTSAEAVQAQLEQDYPNTVVRLSTGGLSGETASIVWKVSESNYNGNARGTYTVYGDLDLTGITTFFNPEGYQAEIEVEVLPPSELEIISVVNPTPITVKQYAMLSNEENKTTEFGSPTIFPKLPEKVTVNLRNGNTAELPAKWNIWECDTTQVGEQTITVYPICDGTNYWISDNTVPGNLKVTVEACDYMFIDATVSDISLEVLPGTTVEELNALLKEQGNHEFPLYMFDLDSGNQMITFYPLTLKEEHCPMYQKDIPGEYDFIIPWPDNILPPEEGELPEVKVTVHVLEPLKITDVELETIEAYQSVPVGHESFPGVPSRVNVTLEGGMIIPVDVVWDWSTYNEDLAAEQLIIGELVNLPSKAKQPEGQEFTGKLKANVKPVAYEITALLSDDPLVADAGLTLSEITQILQPVLTYRIKSVTPEISLTLTREVAVSLEDEKNPQYDPMDAYEDFVVGTLDLPGNITYDPDSGLDLVPLFTFPVEILEYVPCTVIAREGTDFADIPNMPVTVTAKLSSVGPDGQNKTAVISVNWGTGEGYEPYPADLTDDTCVGVEIEGALVNKPRYIAATKKKPVLTVSVCREFDIEELSPNRIPGTGELEVPLGSSLEDIYGKLEQHTVQLTLKSTNGVFSQQDVSFELGTEQDQNYDPTIEEPGSYTLIAHLLHADNIKNPKGLQLEIHIKTMTYDISTAKVTTIKGIAKGTPFEDLPLPETSGAVRDDGETEFLPTTWDNSKYNPTKLGGQFINGTFNTPLPLHLKNPDNRQPKAYITIVDTEATVLSMEQVFEEPAGIRRSRAKTEETPGYVEHKYLLKLQDKDGTIREEVISLYSEEK